MYLPFPLIFRSPPIMTPPIDTNNSRATPFHNTGRVEGPSYFIGWKIFHIYAILLLKMGYIVCTVFCLILALLENKVGSHPRWHFIEGNDSQRVGDLLLL